MLPELRGPEILKQLRKHPNGQKSHVIVMTNFDQDEENRAAIEHNVDAYLVKAEITPRRLIEVIHQIEAVPES